MTQMWNRGTSVVVAEGMIGSIHMKRVCLYGEMMIDVDDAKYFCLTTARLDLEAAATYIFPPISSVILLIFEHSNSYVRFHAWQVSVNDAGLGCNRSSLVGIAAVFWTHCDINFHILNLPLTLYRFYIS